MKNIQKYVAIALGFLVISCSSDEKIIEGVFDTVERGIVLRTVNTISSSYNIFDDSSEWGVTLEVQDEEGGDLLSEVRIFVAFTDNSTDAGDSSTSETLLETLQPSSFSTGPFGLPRTDIVYSLSEVISVSGINQADIEGGDAFSFRLEAQLTDGRVFSNNAAGTVSGGSFFSSPFAYSAGIKCIPTSPVSGDYQLTIEDSFGDGWDGAFITVTIDGTSTDYTIENGSEGNFTINVPDGTTELIWTYTAGNFEAEHSYELIAPTGEVAAADGPGPSAGEIVLNICN